MQHDVAFGEHRGERWTDTLSQTVALAFREDPTWSPVMESSSEPDTPRRYWELFVRSAQRFPWIGTVDGGAAVSIWFPPGADELTPDEQQELPGLATELFGTAAADHLMRIIERFDAARPTGDYFYLSLLATHPSHRGEGLGMRLLEANLRRLDEQGMPSYLESSNPANNDRYQRRGYRPHGTIQLPSGLEIMTLWRDPQPVVSPTAPPAFA